MRTIIPLIMASVISSAHAQTDTCTLNSNWSTCVSNGFATATTACENAYTLSSSAHISVLSACLCTGAEIQASCAKAACSGNTSAQSQLLASYSSCISVHSYTYGTTTSPAAVTSSNATPSGSSTFIPTRTTTTAVAEATGTTGSVTTSQTSITASPSKAAANTMPIGKSRVGGIFALLAGIAALM